MVKPDYYTQDLLDLGLGGFDLWMEDIQEELSEGDVDLMRKTLSNRRYKITDKSLNDLVRRNTSLVV